MFPGGMCLKGKKIWKSIKIFSKIPRTLLEYEFLSFFFYSDSYYYMLVLMRKYRRNMIKEILTPNEKLFWKYLIFYMCVCVGCKHRWVESEKKRERRSPLYFITNCDEKLKMWTVSGPIPVIIHARSLGPCN